MTDTQDKTIRILRKAIEDNGLEMVDDHEWGNIGTLRVETPDSLTPLLNVHYRFNDGYAEFTVTPPNGLGKERDGKLHYVKVEELMDRLVNPLTAVIMTLGQQTAESASAARRAAKVRA